MTVQEQVRLPAWPVPQRTLARSEGEADDAEDMMTRYTDDEWASFISALDVKVEEGKKYDRPHLGGKQFPKTIDHTLLKLDAKAVQIDEICSEALVEGFATVCVRPHFVAKAASNLKGRDVKVASVIGFHEGTYDLDHKVQETKESLDGGADELDIVLNYEALKQRKYASTFKELATLRIQAAPPTLLKLIIETSQMSREQIIAACCMAAAANFDFVKTSTGFNGHGAREEDVRLMAACCEELSEASRGRKMQVKASGGIRTVEDAVKMLEAGASRLGTSGGVGIVKEGREATSKEESGINGGSRPGLTTRLSTDY
ncbi:DeoC/LacD family aldolase [Teratosphaeria destructans]|uniref:deoxyribose-phosphate aldolase n=1 Tax=Teratosphaeria destructans TaxID=418781 RepID=A0A9W7W1G2_9PEZI|nr:DeoC/LacD family aldolase [Teratosphaeria destructans]